MKLSDLMHIAILYPLLFDSQQVGTCHIAMLQAQLSIHLHTGLGALDRYLVERGRYY